MVGGYFNEEYLDQLRLQADPYTRAMMLGWEPMVSNGIPVWRAPNGRIYGEMAPFTYEDLVKALDDEFFTRL